MLDNILWGNREKWVCIISKYYNCFTIEHLLKLPMEELMMFLQYNVQQDFLYTDDDVIASLQACMTQLSKLGLDLAPEPADSAELPTKPFGLFVPPSVEQIIGRRTLETEGELLGGRRRVSIPPDGGPAIIIAHADGGGRGLQQPIGGVVKLQKIDEKDRITSRGGATTEGGGAMARDSMAVSRGGGAKGDSAVGSKVGGVKTADRKVGGVKTADRNGANAEYNKMGVASNRTGLPNGAVLYGGGEGGGRGYRGRGDTAAPQRYEVTVRF